MKLTNKTSVVLKFRLIALDTFKNDVDVAVFRLGPKEAHDTEFPFIHLEVEEA